MGEKNQKDSYNFLMYMQDIERIANEAVRQARLENTRYGIPNTFVKNDVIYYELPNGKITTERPDILK